MKDSFKSLYRTFFADIADPPSISIGPRGMEGFLSVGEAKVLLTRTPSLPQCSQSKATKRSTKEDLYKKLHPQPTDHSQQARDATKTPALLLAGRVFSIPEAQA